MTWKPPKTKKYKCGVCNKPTGILYGKKCEHCEFDTKKVQKVKTTR